MYSILIDTSDKYLSVGLSKDGTIIDSISYECWQRQSEFLISELDNLIKRNNLTRNDIGAIAASRGPGSYTGVRIALTVAKVMAFALNIPLYLTSSLEVLKDFNAPSICVENARSKRSYVGVYDGETVVMGDTILDNKYLLDYIANHPEYKVCGEVAYLGIEGYKADVLESLNNLMNERNLEKDVLASKPVYLKDNY
ncbi:MAG: tRNA (adenosine(37)-N6)-threonylcarbamoyltransferase complex dimerization subunit type 1 TsaB [Bacilli bacterium]|nr:tRNA (adenosine(37)-N6)-threonylcarbamoyltransferase complex dimerization subunit type 1 TsaB [Bacilli bacterium]